MGNQSTQSAPLPGCPSQITHELTWDRKRTPAVGIRQLSYSTECIVYVTLTRFMYIKNFS
jgi:hypothetical protein